MQGGCNPKGNAEGGMRGDQKEREGGTTHRPVSEDTKGKGRNDNVPGGGTETTGGIVSDVPE